MSHFHSLTTASAACISLNDRFSLTACLTQYYQNGKENITMKEIKRRDRKKSVTVAMINVVNNIRKTHIVLRTSLIFFPPEEGIVVDAVLTS